MARFVNTIKFTVTTNDAQEARGQALRVVTVGTDHGYFRDAEIVSVEPVAEPRTYTQAEFDAAVLAAAADARSKALAGVNE